MKSYILHCNVTAQITKSSSNDDDDDDDENDDHDDGDAADDKMAILKLPFTNLIWFVQIVHIQWFLIHHEA